MSGALRHRPTAILMSMVQPWVEIPNIEWTQEKKKKTTPNKWIWKYKNPTQVEADFPIKEKTKKKMCSPPHD